MATKIKFRSEGFRAILCGGGVRSAVYATANGIAKSVPGAKVRVIIGGFGGGRWVGFVSTRPKTDEDAVIQRELLEAAYHGGA